MERIHPLVKMLIENTPGWLDASSLTITPLFGGLDNLAYKIEVGSETFVAKILKDNVRAFGLNKQHEYVAHLLASKAGIAPEIVHFSSDYEKVSGLAFGELMFKYLSINTLSIKFPNAKPDSNLDPNLPGMRRYPVCE